MPLSFVLAFVDAEAALVLAVEGDGEEGLGALRGLVGGVVFQAQGAAVEAQCFVGEGESESCAFASALGFGEGVEFFA